MSTYREPILIFGVVFDSKEDAKKYCKDLYVSDTLINNELGLESFSDNDYYVLGYTMSPGETTEKYQSMWDSFGFGETEKPEAMLDIRVY